MKKQVIVLNLEFWNLCDIVLVLRIFELYDCAPVCQCFFAYIPII